MSDHEMQTHEGGVSYAITTHAILTQSWFAANAYAMNLSSFLMKQIC